MASAGVAPADLILLPPIARVATQSFEALTIVKGRGSGIGPWDAGDVVEHLRHQARQETTGQPREPGSPMGYAIRRGRFTLDGDELVLDLHRRAPRPARSRIQTARRHARGEGLDLDRRELPADGVADPVVDPDLEQLRELLRHARVIDAQGSNLGGLQLVEREELRESGPRAAVVVAREGEDDDESIPDDAQRDDLDYFSILDPDDQDRLGRGQRHRDRTLREDDPVRERKAGFENQPTDLLGSGRRRVPVAGVIEQREERPGEDRAFAGSSVGLSIVTASSRGSAEPVRTRSSCVWACCPCRAFGRFPFRERRSTETPPPSLFRTIACRRSAGAATPGRVIVTVLTNFMKSTPALSYVPPIRPLQSEHCSSVRRRTAGADWAG